MKERVLIKKNVFTCVMFGAIFLFVLCESLFKSDTLSTIAFIIAIPIFMLSLIKLVVDVLEDLNDKITSYLKDTEHRNVFSWEDLATIRDVKEDTLEDAINSITPKYTNYIGISDNLKKYFYARKTRTSIRIFRRAMLYIYYAVFMTILLLLLLHTELYSLLESTSWLSSINMDLFEVWSLIIILLEIMMKDIIEDAITYIIDKKMGMDLEYY